MNRLLAAILLLLFVLLLPFIVDAQDGYYGIGHAENHRFYKDWNRPGTTYSCCNERDCRPTRACFVDQELGVMVDGKCLPVPAKSVLRIPSPDEHTHVCIAKGAKEPACVVFGPPRS